MFSPKKNNNNNKKSADIVQMCHDDVASMPSPPYHTTGEKIFYTWNNTFMHTLLSRIYLSVFIVGELHRKRLLYFKCTRFPKCRQQYEMFTVVWVRIFFVFFFWYKRNKVAIAPFDPHLMPRKKGRIYHFCLLFDNNIGKVKAHLTGLQPWFKYLNIFGDKLR